MIARETRRRRVYASRADTEEIGPVARCRERFRAAVQMHRSDPLPWIQDWDATYWPVNKRTTSASAGDGGVWFTPEAMTKSGGGTPFNEPFLSLMKLAVSDYDSRKAGGYQVANLQGLVAAGRWLYPVITKRNAQPWEICAADLTNAYNAAACQLGDGIRNVGSKLTFISRLLAKYDISPAPFEWTSPYDWSRTQPLVGQAADSRRERRLPSPGVLDALAEFSAQQTSDGEDSPLEPRDLLCQRAIDILVSGPFRISEVLTLPRNALVEEPLLDQAGEQLLDRFGKPKFAVGLRYWPAKGGHKETQLKWFPSAMADVVRRAVHDVLEITEPFAAIARYQRDNPLRTCFRDAQHSLLQQEWLSGADVARILGLGQGGSELNLSSAGRQFCWYHDIPRTALPKRGRPIVVRLGDLEKALYLRSFHGNALVGSGTLDISECLFVTSALFMKRHLSAGLDGTVAPVTDEQIRVYLRGSAAGVELSIFARRGKLDTTGAPLRMKPHQLRHLMTTLADEGGLSELDQARWAGRADLTHNKSYHHTPARDLARQVRRRMMDGETLGPVAEALLQIRDPVRREEFVLSTARTAHVTDKGICVHDWEGSPCPRHGCCEDCWELRIVKGDEKDLSAAKQCRTETLAQLELAEREKGEGTYGADRWEAAHRRSLERLDKIIAIHEDLDIPNGALVQLPGSGCSSTPNCQQRGRTAKRR